MDGLDFELNARPSASTKRAEGNDADFNLDDDFLKDLRTSSKFDLDFGDDKKKLDKTSSGKFKPASIENFDLDFGPSKPSFKASAFSDFDDFDDGLKEWDIAASPVKNARLDSRKEEPAEDCKTTANQEDVSEQMDLDPAVAVAPDAPSQKQSDPSPASVEAVAVTQKTPTVEVPATSELSPRQDDSLQVSKSAEKDRIKLTSSREQSSKLDRRPPLSSKEQNSKLEGRPPALTLKCAEKGPVKSTSNTLSRPLASPSPARTLLTRASNPPQQVVLPAKRLSCTPLAARADSLRNPPAPMLKAPALEHSVRTETLNMQNLAVPVAAAVDSRMTEAFEGEASCPQLERIDDLLRDDTAKKADDHTKRLGASTSNTPGRPLASPSPENTLLTRSSNPPQQVVLPAKRLSCTPLAARASTQQACNVNPPAPMPKAPSPEHSARTETLNMQSLAVPVAAAVDSRMTEAFEGEASDPQLEKIDDLLRDDTAKKADDHMKRLDAMYHTLKRKHEEAKDLLVKAMVHNSMLHMLNNPIIEDKIASIRRSINEYFPESATAKSVEE